MQGSLLNSRRQLFFMLTLVLSVGFLTISLVSYHSSRTTIHESIVSNQLPLTSDNIYSEIQKDLIRPVLISSLMAGDTFVRDWVLRGEQNEREMSRYLKEIMSRYGAFTSFFVSDKTLAYYHADGRLKTVHPDEVRDRWYFRVRKIEEPYEINLDPDLANKDALTIFINYRVLDYDGKFIGATGIGLTADAVQKLIDTYQQRYQRRIYFVDANGKVVALSKDTSNDRKLLRNMPGIGPLADQILSGTQSTHQYQRDGKQIVLNARNIPELKWHLIVEQDEDDALSAIRRTLYLNIAIVLLVGSLSIWLTGLTINRYQRKLEDMAVTDKLTGLANRQAFAPLIEQTLSEIKRNPEPLSLIIADIDHFKQVNDSHGHQVGDRVLQHTAESIANALRDSDLIFRWGGEEFLIIVRGCEGKDAFRLAEKLRQAVESTSVEVDGKAVRTTLSTGVAVRREGEDVDSLIGRADRALYAAKAAGRNCSRLSGET